jgi:peptidoglycan/LPS O-acetylase OafA/YrhL
MAELPLVNSIAAAMILFYFINSPAAQKRFSSHVPRFLGRISYSLYLLHMPLLYTIFSALYLRIGKPPNGLWLAAWVLIYLISSGVAAWAMTVWIDGPATRLAEIGKPRTTTETPRAS